MTKVLLLAALFVAFVFILVAVIIKWPSKKDRDK